MDVLGALVAMFVASFLSCVVVATVFFVACGFHAKYAAWRYRRRAKREGGAS